MAFSLNLSWLNKVLLRLVFHCNHACLRRGSKTLLTVFCLSGSIKDNEVKLDEKQHQFESMVYQSDSKASVHFCLLNFISRFTLAVPPWRDHKASASSDSVVLSLINSSTQSFQVNTFMKLSSILKQYGIALTVYNTRS